MFYEVEVGWEVELNRFTLVLVIKLTKNNGIYKKTYLTLDSYSRSLSRLWSSLYGV